MGKLDALSRRSDHGTGTNDNSDVVLLTPKLFAVRALEGLQFTRPEQDILQDIQQETKQPKEEPVARAAQELRKSSTCSSDPQNGRNATASSTTAVASTSWTLLTSAAGQSRSAMTPRWLDTQAASKPWSSSPEVTGGQTYRGT